MGTVLVIDREPTVKDAVTKLSSAYGFETVNALDAATISEALQSRPEVVVVGVHYDGCDVVSALSCLGRLAYQGPLVLISSVDDATLRTTEHLSGIHGLHHVHSLDVSNGVSSLQWLFDNIQNAEDPSDALGEVAQAVTGRKLVNFYQPQFVMSSTGQPSLSGVEALVRIVRPDGSIITPQRIIAECEQLGLMDALTEQVLNTAVMQLIAWRQAGVDLGVSINLPPDCLESALFIENLVGLLGGSPELRSSITFEITEATEVRSMVSVMQTLIRLKMMGFRLAIDDFGTGHASLQQLYQLPFDELKIDKRFIIDGEKSHDAQVISELCIRLGHDLGLSVCAEGVETSSAMKWLCGLGCDVFQGFHLAKPMPITEFESIYLSAGAVKAV